MKNGFDIMSAALNADKAVVDYCRELERRRQRTLKRRRQRKARKQRNRQAKK